MINQELTCKECNRFQDCKRIRNFENMLKIDYMIKIMPSNSPWFEVSRAARGFLATLEFIVILQSNEQYIMFIRNPCVKFKISSEIGQMVKITKKSIEEKTRATPSFNKFKIF